MWLHDQHVCHVMQESPGIVKGSGILGVVMVCRMFSTYVSMFGISAMTCASDAFRAVAR